ncbi:MAG: hypothetical protein Q9170_006260 [Blastenia crenularia]
MSLSYRGDTVPFGLEILPTCFKIGSFQTIHSSREPIGIRFTYTRVCLQHLDFSSPHPRAPMSMTNSTGNCANVHAPNYTFPGFTSPACGVLSQDTSANITILLDTGCCDKGSAIYSDPAQPCIHYCSTSRNNESFAQCVSHFATVPGFEVEKSWCLNNQMAQTTSAAGKMIPRPLAETGPSWQSVALLGFVVALGFCAM